MYSLENLLQANHKVSTRVWNQTPKLPKLQTVFLSHIPQSNGWSYPTFGFAPKWRLSYTLTFPFAPKWRLSYTLTFPFASNWGFCGTQLFGVENFDFAGTKFSGSTIVPDGQKYVSNFMGGEILHPRPQLFFRSIVVAIPKTHPLSLPAASSQH